MYQKLNAAFENMRQRTSFNPKIAIVLGSGLGRFGDHVEVECVIPYHEIEGFPISTAPGHKGRFVFTWVDGVPVVLMQGRIHYYEGYSMEEVVLPIRLMHMLGAELLFLTNAAGGVKTTFREGSFMLIEDQISCFVPSPLIGPNDERMGARFPDMTEIYDRALRKEILKTAWQQDIQLEQGVYLQLTGPQYESPAEIRMCRMLGADAVGMSTCCEAIAARHLGMRVCGISCISNLAAGMGDGLLSAEDVNESADRVGEQFEQLITGSLKAFRTTGLI